MKAAYRSPYGTVGERAGIDAFVADVPVGSGHPSRAALDEVTQGVGRLAAAGVPTLVAWGPRDPVFGEWFLRDWRARVPHADVHRFAHASHLVPEDPAFADVVLRWLDERVLHPTPPRRLRRAPRRRGVRAVVGGTVRAGGRPAGRRDARSGGDAHRTRRRDHTQDHLVGELDRRTRELAAGFVLQGVQPGQRVSLLCRPGRT